MASPAAIANALSAQTQSNSSSVVPGMSPLTAGYNQWVAGRSLGPGLPRTMNDFLSGAFGPLSPIVPMPVDVPQEETGRPMPRRWQYPVGWNMPVGQPGTEGLKLASFAALRQYADIYSVVRAMLNIRKDELAGLDWDIGPTPDAQAQSKSDKGKVSDQHDRAMKIVRFFKHVDPDYNGFQSWFTALLEEMFVIDAPALYLHPTKVEGKGLFGSSLAHLVAINGATIRPLVDMYGSTPRPPAPAYQQYLWGVPRTDLMSVITDEDLEIMAQSLEKEVGEPETEYRADQLLYMPRTRRTWTPYGFSPIEQAIMPITLGLKRQEFLLDFFTEGTIPGVYVIAGDQYVTPAQQRQLQDSLNALAGDQAWKHRVIVLPPGSKTDAQKDLSWQEKVDQTITEQVAMILHIQPHEIGMVPGGRTSGLGGKGMVQGQQDAVTEQRTLPDRKWLKETLFDWVIQDVFGQKDLEWKWVDFDEEEDKEQKANAEKSNISIGKLSIDETRIEDGLDPWNTPYTQKPFVLLAGQIVPLDPSLPPLPATPAGPGGGPGGETSPDGSPLPPGHKMHPDGVHMVPPVHSVDPITGEVKTPEGEKVPTEKLPVAPTGQAPPAAVGPDGKPIVGPDGKPLVSAVGPDGKPLPSPTAGAGTPHPPGEQPGKTPFGKQPVTKPGPGAAAPVAGQGSTTTALPGAKKPKGKPKGLKLTVSDLVKGHIKYKGDLTKVVYGYLLRSYPKDVVDWAKDKSGEWSYDPEVKLSDINMARRPGGRDPNKVESIADSLDSGASMDPIVLVARTPANGYKYEPADGWHRLLGAEKAGWDAVPAFIGTGFDQYMDVITGDMQDESDSKKKAALAEVAVLRRFLRKGNDLARFDAHAIDPDTMKLLRRGELTLDAARDRISKQRGNPQGLIDWYNEGADGQIDWGSSGDFDQCVEVASAYMTDEQAKGFCNLRHEDATGMSTSEHAAEDKGEGFGRLIPRIDTPLRDRLTTKYSPEQERGPDGRWVGGDGGTIGPRVGTMTTHDEEGYEHEVPVHSTSRGMTVALHPVSIGQGGKPLLSVVEEVRPHPGFTAGTGHWQGLGEVGTFEHKAANPYKALAIESAQMEKDFSLSAPLSTGLVPYDLAGAKPSPGSVCSICGEKLGPDGLCETHGAGKAFILEQDSEGGEPVSKYSDDQARDEHGRWVAAGGGEDRRVTTEDVRTKTVPTQFDEKQAATVHLRTTGAQIGRVHQYSSVAYGSRGGDVRYANVWRSTDDRGRTIGDHPSKATAVEYVTRAWNTKVRGDSMYPPYTKAAVPTTSKLLEAIDAELERRGFDKPRYPFAAKHWGEVEEGKDTKQGENPGGVSGVVRDGVHYGVGVGKDEDGVFVHTHRMRSKSYPTLDDIPTSVLEEVDESG